MPMGADPPPRVLQAGSSPASVPLGAEGGCAIIAAATATFAS
jgi:hypothetical protein